VSPGIAIGPAILFGQDRFEIPKYEVKDASEELKRFELAVEKTRIYLQNLHRKTIQELGEGHADIFKAHLLVLEDVAILDEVKNRITEEKVNAESILDELSRHYAAILSSVDDARFQARTADLLDVMDRLQRNLLDEERPHLRELPAPGILLAHDIPPSDTATMDRKHVLGMALDSGSATSHTAILARALEIPAVMGLRHASLLVVQSTPVIVDGNEGLFIANPSPDTLTHYEEERRRQLEMREALRSSAHTGPSTTLDGVSIPALANIELPFELVPELRTNAEGIGLFRTEYLFLNRNTLPSEEEQYQAYRKAAETMHPAPVILRTMDIGGDKLVSHLQISKEDNPQLGWRAVRFCLERLDVFRPQLRAMLRASAVGNIQIMFPMISGLEELRRVKQVVEEVALELESEGIEYDKDIKIGSMIEVPSAVTLTDLLSKECDFFSIGTNDLIQYSLAVDRVNEKIAHLYEPAHPAVLRMIKWTCNAASRSGIPCSICGEMAGDPLYTEVLIGLGVTSLSMSAVSLPQVRAEIAQIDYKEAKSLALDIMKMGTAEEIKALLTERYLRRQSMAQYLAAVRARNAARAAQE
jgi:phosphotransferase system enzyme I (PtsI)